MEHHDFQSGDPTHPEDIPPETAVPERAKPQNAGGPQLPLAPRHRALLEEESAISPQSIAARGAFSVAGDANGRETLRDLGFTPLQSRLGSGLIFPTHNWRGEVVGHTFRPDIPRNDSRGKARKYEMPAGSTPVLDVAVLTRADIDNPLVDLLWTEGARKADAAASKGLVAISLNGVYGFRGQNLKGGIANLGELDEIVFKGKVSGKAIARRNLLVFDSDWEEKDGVYSALRRLASAIEARGGQVKMVTLEAGPGGEKTGLDDFFARGGTVEGLLAKASDLVGVAERERRKSELAREKKRDELEEAAKAAGVPVIDVANRQLSDLTRELAGAVGDYNGREFRLFHGAYGLSQLVADKNGATIISGASVEVMQDVAGQAAWWVAGSPREGVRNVFPPRDLCSIFAQTPSNWRNILPLDSIVNAPFFDAHGHLVATRGYHATSRVWLDVPPDFALPDVSPSDANLASAKHLIFDVLLGEMAFANRASFAHTVALFLLPLVRRLIPQCTPLHVIDAPKQANGKTLVAQVCIAPYTEPEAMDDSREEGDWGKVIFAALLEGRTHLFFDNIVSRMSAAALASTLTSPTKSGRILGQSRMARVSTLNTIWVTTSNNAQLVSDITSRSIQIRLDTGLERPENKVYKGDPLAYIQNHRAQVLGALITFVNRWIAEGRPLFTKRKNRFASWSGVIGGILETIGVEGFLENMEEARENMSTENVGWHEFVQEWFDSQGSRGATTKTLLPIALGCPALAESLSDKELTAKRLGDLLGKRRDQVFGDYKIVRDPDRSKGGFTWRLVPMERTQTTLEDIVDDPNTRLEETGEGVDDRGVGDVTNGGVTIDDGGFNEPTCPQRVDATNDTDGEDGVYVPAEAEVGVEGEREVMYL